MENVIVTFVISEVETLQQQPVIRVLAKEILPVYVLTVKAALKVQRAKVPVSMAAQLGNGANAISFGQLLPAMFHAPVEPLSRQRLNSIYLRLQFRRRLRRFLLSPP